MSCDDNAPQPASATATVAYRLSLDPQHSRIDVEATLPGHAATPYVVFLPVWTPGSYLLREYARQIEAVRYADAEDLWHPCHKVRKNAWEVPTVPHGPVRLRYSIYARELSVRTNYVSDAFALVVGAATFITHAPSMGLRHTVDVQLPESYQTALCALPNDSEAPQRFVASDYDQLVDAPIYAGSPRTQRFVEDGKELLLVTEGGDSRWPEAQALEDVARIVRTQARMWGGLPFARYVFFNLLVEARGGLEHKDCAVLMASGWAARSRADYLDWLGLVSHEFFHVWNIKRLRPVELGPFDYQAENTTTSLWIAEGFTAYYDDLSVHRAGLCSLDEYLARLGKTLERVQNVPGRLVQPLAEASFDAWIKLYRRDENSDNATVNYYLKGSIVAFLLDAKIRLLTGGSKSLDDVMRLAFARYSGTHGYTDAAFRAVCDEVASTPLAPFFLSCVDTAAELDLREALSYYGLHCVPPKRDALGGGTLGIVPRNDGGRLFVGEVTRGGAAWEAGLQPDDELLGIDAWRVPPSRFVERLKSFAPGAKLSLLVARRERLARLPVTLQVEHKAAVGLAVVPQPTAAQSRALQQWLAPPGARS